MLLLPLGVSVFVLPSGCQLNGGEQLLEWIYGIKRKQKQKQSSLLDCLVCSTALKTDKQKICGSIRPSFTSRSKSALCDVTRGTVVSGLGLVSSGEQAFFYLVVCEKFNRALGLHVCVLVCVCVTCVCLWHFDRVAIIVPSGDMTH